MNFNDLLGSGYNDDPFDWDDARVKQYMQHLNVDARLIEAQQQIRYKGSDFIMYDEDHIFRFFKAQTSDEKLQLRKVRDNIHQKSNNFNSQNLEDSENVVLSQLLKVTGHQKNSDISNINTGTTVDDSESQNIRMELSGFFRYNSLPYDPFDFDTIQNYESAKTTFEDILNRSQLYHSYGIYKSKRSDSKKISTQLVLEVKRLLPVVQGGDPLLQTNSSTNSSASTAGSTSSSSSSSSTNIEKFAIKENQSVTLGQINCDLILKDKAVSRKHAVIENLSTGCSVQDLGSSCGTFVRIRNQQIPLETGSIFECGFQEFQVKKIEANGDSARVMLLVYDGSEAYKNKTFDLNIQNRFLIGKDIRCHFGSEFQEDRDLSQYHAKLSIKDNVLSIMDLDSVKGTWLRLSPLKKESGKFILTNDSEIKINPYLISVKINTIGADVFPVQTSIPSSASNHLVSQGLCIACKSTKSNLLLLPCTHVVYCKACFQKIHPKACPKPDCNAPIKQVETVYN